MAPVQMTRHMSSRRVRHDVADALRLAVFSLAVSALVALALAVFSRWAGAA